MIVPIHPPLDGISAERFLALSQGLSHLPITDESGRERLLKAESDWVMTNTIMGEEERNAYDASVRVLVDLHRLGWRVRESGYGIELSVQQARTGGLTPAEIQAEKTCTKAMFTPAVNAQLGDAAVRAFIDRMEQPGSKTGKHPVTELIADGAELHARLTAGAREGNLEEGYAQLPVRPYLQLVTATGVDDYTGHGLREIWRYFRYTWSIPQFSTPGRQMLYLVRDAAHPCHAVMGIIGLNNTGLQMGESREKDLGWSRALLIERLESAAAHNQLAPEYAWLTDRVGDALAGVESEGLANPDELDQPSPALIAHLRRKAREFDHLRDETLRRLKTEDSGAGTDLPRSVEGIDNSHPPVSDAVLALEAKPSTNATMQQARRHLVARKRAALLADLLQARLTLRTYRSELNDPQSLPRILNREDVGVALQTVLDSLKSRYAGVNILEVSTCGAIQPYNRILGGKLAALMLFAPQIADDYRQQYNTPSIIASQIKNAEVRRDNTLVYLATTSLYAQGSSQYERVRLPAGTISPEQEELRFNRLGMTAGYGTLQFMDATRQSIERFLHGQQGFGDINSIFGEGPSPKLRLLTAGLTRLGFPPDSLMQHNRRRLIYGISLTRQARDFLSSRSVELPDYLVNPGAFRDASERIALYWARRWLSSRMNHSPSITALLTDRRWKLSDRLPTRDYPGEPKMPTGLTQLAEPASGESTPPPSAPGFWFQIASAGPKTTSDALTPVELERLHIDLAVEPFIADQVAKGNSIFLTGNAGDGKTHVLRRLGPRLKELGAIVVEDATACMRRNQITPVLDRWRQAIRSKSPFCIAINEYPLYLLRAKAREIMPELAAELDRQCRSRLNYGQPDQQGVPTQGLLVVDLSLRNPLSPTIAGQMIDRVLDDESLDSVSEAEVQSLAYNRQRLADSVVKQRLLDLFSRLADIGVRVTMRELWIYLSRMVLGYRGDLEKPMGTSLPTSPAHIPREHGWTQRAEPDSMTSTVQHVRYRRAWRQRNISG